MRKRHGKARLFGIAAIIGLLAAGTYAFTNTNTVGATRAGQGEGTISGYAVTNILYTSSATNPHKLQQVEFDLDQAASTVRVSITNAADNVVTGATGQTWYNCTGLLNHWTCSLGATDLLRPEISAANELDVVALQ
jgi:hypothetical protein